MKILGWRGENLASLESYDVSLVAEPLVDTRLFSIIGPTGSGKSTLLDGLCLALYDRVPRLTDARGADEELSPQDPRSVLRRGAGFGSAEVDFVGRDGRAYRASWEVWRARRAAEGRIQNQRLRLYALDPMEELTGKHKTETLGAIQDRVGLDFDQFRRAVLLAQGDFSAFLRARPEERALLLERMTGTEEFSAVSSAAYRLHRDRRQALEAFEAEASTVVPLDDAARSGLEGQLAEQQRRVQAAEQDRDRQREAQGIRQRLDELSLEMQEATRRQTEANRRWEVSAPLRTRVERAQALAPLVPVWRSLQRAEDDLARTEESIMQLVEQEEHATALLSTATDEQARARREQDELERAWAKLEPELDAARRLDDGVAELTQQRSAAQVEVEAFRAGWAPAVRALVRLTDALATAERDLAQVDGSVLPTEASLLTEWDGLEPELRQLTDASAEASAVRAEIAQQWESQAAARTRRTDAAEAAEPARVAHREAQAALFDSRRRLARHREGGTPRAVTEALTRLSRLSASQRVLETVLEEDRRAARRATQAERAQAQLQVQIRKVRAAARRHTRRRRQLEAEAAALGERIQLDTVRGQLARHRHALLVDGEPCPLCGSHDRGPVPDPSAEPPRDVARHRRLQEQIESTENRRRETEREEHQLMARSEELAERQRGWSEFRADAVRQWLALRKEVELSWVDSGLLARHRLQTFGLKMADTPDPRILPELVRRIRAIEEELSAHAEADEALAGDVEAREREEAERRAESERRSAEERAADEALARWTSRIDLANQRLDTLEALRTSALGRCRARMGEAPPDLASDPASVLARLSRTVERLRSLQEHAEQLRQVVRRLKDERQESRRRVLSEHQRFEALRARVERRGWELDRLCRDRAQRLGGRSTEAVGDEWAARREASRARSEAAQQGLLALTQQRVERQARERELRSRRTQLAQQVSELTKEWEHGLRSLGLPPPTDPGWIASTEGLDEDRAAVEALALARQEAEATLHDRSERQRRFVDSLPELPPDRETVGAAVAAAEAELESARRSRDDLRRALDADDGHRARTAELSAHRTRLEHELALSAELAELIGSADGKKFRTYAQGLTLESLLSQANLHLERLRPRYRLQRATGRDIDIQVVDRDLGDETRSVATLSGGETFLVSLSLALGLSSLSAQDVTIESLFIDEGFGHLDRDSLEVAIATLDELQAEGRTVGIVSHVPEVADRIGYAIEVTPVELGRSRVSVRGP
jgi:exonuclease SbcC